MQEIICISAIIALFLFLRYSKTMNNRRTFELPYSHMRRRVKSLERMRKHIADTIKSETENCRKNKRIEFSYQVDSNLFSCGLSGIDDMQIEEIIFSACEQEIKKAGIEGKPEISIKKKDICGNIWSVYVKLL
ncbi:MAG: hypothetical protein LBN27_00855 [Prevotellaceae bacterium]|jgi:hypothetical protein|nr:hypothetical protein [Prevotellaceae bacterium]